jgi:hypothetical protein
LREGVKEYLFSLDKEQIETIQVWFETKKREHMSQYVRDCLEAIGFETCQAWTGVDYDEKEP